MPAAPKIPTWLTELYPGDQRAAIDYLRPRVDEQMLREIAAADYGQDIDKHMEALMPLWEGGEIVELGSWFPMEVLELIRWSTPGGLIPHEVPDTRGHVIRAYCCAVLLATPNFEPEKETLIQLLESMLLSGGDAPDVLARFLVWKIPTLEHEEDRPFFALALAALPLLHGTEVTTYQEYELEQWVVAEEAREREYLAGYSPDYGTAPWLFGLSFNDMLNSRWRVLIERLKVECGDGVMASMSEVRMKKG
jgi:hypothetical protein